MKKNKAEVIRSYLTQNLGLGPTALSQRIMDEHPDLKVSPSEVSKQMGPQKDPSPQDGGEGPLAGEAETLSVADLLELLQAAKARFGEEELVRIVKLV